MTAAVLATAPPVSLVKHSCPVTGCTARTEPRNGHRSLCFWHSLVELESRWPGMYDKSRAVTAQVAFDAMKITVGKNAASKAKW